MAGSCNGDELLVGTYHSGHIVEKLPSSSLELGTSGPLGVTSDQYGLLASTRDIRHNASLTEPHRYPGGPGMASTLSASPFANEPILSMSETGHQQQKANEYFNLSEPYPTEYFHLLKKISDLLDAEQVTNLCFISEKAESAGIRNRTDFSGIVLLNFFHRSMLISPNNLTYLRSQLHAIDRLDLCNLIDQYNSRILSPQPLPPGDPPAEERPPPYNPEFVSAQHSQPQSHSFHHLSSANTIQQMPPMVGRLGEHSSFSLPCQAQDDEVVHTDPPHSGYANYPGMGSTGVVTCLNPDQVRIKELEDMMACLQLRLQGREDIIIRQADIIKHKNTIIENLICPDGPVEKYTMNKSPHGLAVIINNFEFYSTDPAFKQLPDRPGSCADEENLHATWECLGYHVLIFRNLAASELTRQLMRIALHSHENYDSFVCCILSHGDQDCIHGADSKPVEIKDIASKFKPTFCSTLAGKPKLFFIQACRGENEDLGFVLQKDGIEDDIESFRRSLPNDSDFLFGYATTPGNVSWRSCRYGTVYISQLCEVFNKYAPHQDLLSMLTIVNYRVSEVYTTQGHKQCPAPVTQLRKQVWLISRSTE